MIAFPDESPKAEPGTPSPVTPPGDAGAGGDGVPVDEALVEAVRAELAKPPREAEGGALGKLVLFAATLVLFVASGLVREAVADVAILVGVVFFHEMGHFAGMKLLDYRDVKMFFIPFLGAAVSGRETAPNALKETLVLFLGPAPGILLGIGAGFAFLLTGSPLLKTAADVLILLNVFNLLPFHPLDGGQLFNTLLLSNHPRLGTAFKAVTVVSLGALAAVAGVWILAGFAFLVLLSVPASYARARNACQIRAALPDPGPHPPADVPLEFLRHTLASLRGTIDAQRWRPEAIAAGVRNLWQIVRYRPCPRGIAAGFLALQFTLVALGIVSALFFALPEHLAKS